ncbi:helix-turn-helix transcriptional regulator [Tissierella sp.]|uniref:helix-turn-helix domain-containing protein n=1 Tax=Tissierella sp. TaxID=41274 RepID=UPI0030D7473D
MIKVKILELLEKDERNISWLSRKTGLNYSSLHKFSNNQTTSVTFDVLEKVCKTLGCDISDILEIADD